MKYKCILIDHDDTVVNSTENIHFKSFVEYLKIHRPDAAMRYTLESYIEKNFDIGLMGIFRDELSMSEDEIAEEGRFWSEFVEDMIPEVYDGIADILRDYYKAGGIIAVSSHSAARFILRDYTYHKLPLPNAIFGCELSEEERKPSPYAIEHLCKRYGIRADEILVIDDSKVGLLMARAGGADFAAAGWAYKIERIEKMLRAEADFYLDMPMELR